MTQAQAPFAAERHVDILGLSFADNRFDRVLAEAVTMFVDRPAAAKELVRVCRPGGRVLATEFLWRKPPPPEAHQIFLGEVCFGMNFDTLDDWVQIYREAGLEDVQVTSGPFEMMTPAGFVRDEGIANSLAVMGRALPPVLSEEDGLAHATHEPRRTVPRLHRRLGREASLGANSRGAPL